MSTPETPSNDGLPDVFADEFRNAAGSMRATAKWIASAFGAIPAVVGASALIKGPGTAGWDAHDLWLGACLVVLGTVVGIFGFAWVQFPGDLKDDSVTQLDMEQVPEAAGYGTFKKLLKELERMRTNVANQRKGAAIAKGVADANTAAAVDAEALLTALVASVTESLPLGTGDAAQQLSDQVREARASVIAARHDAAKSDSEAALAAAAVDSDMLVALEGLRTAAFGATLARQIHGRFVAAIILGALAAFVVAAGVVLIAEAPKDKPDTSASSPALALVTPNAAGFKALGCTVPSGTPRPIPAIVLGGSAGAPKIFTLGSAQCRTQTILVFPTGASPLGTISP